MTVAGKAVVLVAAVQGNGEALPFLPLHAPVVEYVGEEQIAPLFPPHRAFGRVAFSISKAVTQLFNLHVEIH